MHREGGLLDEAGGQDGALRQQVHHHVRAGQHGRAQHDRWHQRCRRIRPDLGGELQHTAQELTRHQSGGDPLGGERLSDGVERQVHREADLDAAGRSPRRGRGAQQGHQQGGGAVRLALQLQVVRDQDDESAATEGIERGARHRSHGAAEVGKVLEHDHAPPDVGGAVFTGSRMV